MRLQTNEEVIIFCILLHFLASYTLCWKPDGLIGAKCPNLVTNSCSADLQTPKHRLAVSTGALTWLTEESSNQHSWFLRLLSHQRSFLSAFKRNSVCFLVKSGLFELVGKIIWASVWTKRVKFGLPEDRSLVLFVWGVKSRRPGCRPRAGTVSHCVRPSPQGSKNLLSTPSKFVYNPVELWHEGTAAEETKIVNGGQADAVKRCAALALTSRGGAPQIWATSCELSLKGSGNIWFKQYLYKYWVYSLALSS